MNKLEICTTSKKPIIQLAVWTGIWLFTSALATFGPIYLWDFTLSLTAAAVILNFIVGIGMILANIHHLVSLDEMMQKIQLEAMGITLGVVLVSGLSYSLLDSTDLITSDAEISVLIILMGLTYITSVVVFYRRYQ